MDINETRRGLEVKEIVPLNRVRKAMSKGMKTTVETLAIGHLGRELDLTRVQAMRRERMSEGVKPSLNTLIMLATARILPAHIWFNAELVENEIVVYKPINLGMAVATPMGLIVCVIPDADKMCLTEMDQYAKALAERARSGKLALRDIEGGTFTVSNLGMFGIDEGMAIPRPPESSILLLGTAKKRPVVVDDQIVIGETCWASITYDHRFLDGAMVGEFLMDLDCLLSEPEKLFA